MGIQQHAPRHVYDVVVIGAGISGIGAGIRLLQDGFTNFAILEKAQDLGGTWRDNTYPGCECDVPSALYSFSFAQKADWTRTFAGQQEILDYVKQTAARFGVPAHVKFEQPVERAQWIEADKHWCVTTPDNVYHARFVITCSGYLHEPIIPAIPGLADFPGKLFHSSRWDHQHALSGERVAVIGTGASAIQFIPEIQPAVERLAVFQRTPQWILPKPNGRVSTLQKRALQRTSLINAKRQGIFNGLELFGIGFRRPTLLRGVQKLAETHLQYAVRDPELRAKLTPDYTLGCKRVLMSNAYYPALGKPNVDVFATGVSSIEGNVVVGTDGSRAEVDTIILGTGFYVTEQPIAQCVFDGQGRSLSTLWQRGMQAYRGTTIAGIPNAFMVLGPNLGIGHNSAFIVIEAQLNYIMSALRLVRRKQLRRVEVKDDVQARYNAVVQKALQSTVWNTGGCSSYYLDKNGFNSIGFPWSTLKMQAMLRRFDSESYRLESIDSHSTQHDQSVMAGMVV